MPNINDRKHHCVGCKEKSSTRKTHMGFCPEHHQICSIHTNWYYLIDPYVEECKSCKEAEMREVQARRREAEAERKKQGSKKTELDSFLSQKKGRKDDRDPDKGKKKKN